MRGSSRDKCIYTIHISFQIWARQAVFFVKVCFFCQLSMSVNIHGDPFPSVRINGGWLQCMMCLLPVLESSYIAVSQSSWLHGKAPTSRYVFSARLSSPIRVMKNASLHWMIFFVLETFLLSFLSWKHKIWPVKYWESTIGVSEKSTYIQSTDSTKHPRAYVFLNYKIDS